MRVLLTQVSVRRSGNVARSDEEVDCEFVGVGRALSNQIVLEGLAIALEHAHFVQRTDGVYLVPLPACSVLLAGGLVDDDVKVQVGDVARIGGYELSIAGIGSDGFDLSIDYQHVEERKSEFAELQDRATMKLEHGMWTRRRWSWIGVVSVLVGTLVVPLATGYRGSWNTGPISNNHAQIANECEACHSAFTPVENESCMECHRQTSSHVDERPEFAHLDTLRCASCHIEHSGESGLAALQDVACAACHADLDEHYETTKLARAADFSGEHPEFTLHMLKPVAAIDGVRQEPEIDRVAWRHDVTEASGLLFDHLTHVGGVRFADSSRSNMRCDSCHTPDEGGRRMKPVNYELHCRSCHALNYSRGKPEALHAEPGELLRQLQRVFLDDVLVAQPGESDRDVRRRRDRLTRPGGRRTAEEGPPADRAKASADRAFNLLMSDAYCGECHRLVPEENPSDVAPVAITQHWLGSTLFDHASHASTQCGVCHPRAAVHSEESAAEDGFVRALGTLPDDVPFGLTSTAELKLRGIEPSRHASDILVLGEESCRDCHGGALSRPPEVASPCVMCHLFHQEDFDTIASRTGSPH